MSKIALLGITLVAIISFRVCASIDQGRKFLWRRAERAGQFG